MNQLMECVVAVKTQTRDEWNSRWASEISLLTNCWTEVRLRTRGPYLFRISLSAQTVTWKGWTQCLLGVCVLGSGVGVGSTGLNFSQAPQVWQHKHKRKEVKTAFRRLNGDTSVLTNLSRTKWKKKEAVLSYCTRGSWRIEGTITGYL